MGYEMTGTVKLVTEPQTFSGGFAKREIILRVQDGQYMQEICIEFVQDKVALLDNAIADQKITVSFNIKGREYNGRYYNNLQGWRIESVGPEVEDVKKGSDTFLNEPLDYDDIPF